MSNMAEIKQRLGRLSELSKKMREQFERLKGPEGEAMKKKAKEHGTRVGIGAGVSFFGLVVAGVASIYVLAVIILLVNIGLNRLWLSALIVVGGFLLIGGVILAVGVSMASSSAKELSKATEDARKQMKQTGEEIKAEMEELQKLAKVEAEERKRQMTEMAETAKAAAPVAAPVAIVAYLGYRILKRRRKARKERRAILRVIEMYEEVRTQRERAEADTE